MVTSFEPNKAVGKAIEACNQIGCELRIVGESGRYRDEYEKISRENVHFLGRVSDSKLIELYAGAQALIHPGVDDFGIVAVESLASGTPVIGYRNSGVGEIILRVAQKLSQDSHSNAKIGKSSYSEETADKGSGFEVTPCGVLLNNSSAGTLAAAMKYIMSDSGKTIAGRKLLQQAVGVFNPDRFKDELREIIGRVVTKK